MSGNLNGGRPGVTGEAAGFPREPRGAFTVLGQRVKHPKFGEGVVLNYEGKGKNARVQINFDDVGGKWLVMSYARLEAV